MLRYCRMVFGVIIKMFHANAKINIGLKVLRKRADGYHDIESVFLPVKELHDNISLIPSDEVPLTPRDCRIIFGAIDNATIEHSEMFSTTEHSEMFSTTEHSEMFSTTKRSEAFSTTNTRLSNSGIGIDCPAEKNLAVRAMNLMVQRFEKVKPLNISIEKNIPIGAGLGGGSSDAAFTIKAINDIYGLKLSDKEMEELVAPLGADCPFFIKNEPRLATGTGNIFSPVPDNFMRQIEGKYLLLVTPPIAVSTAEAYGGVRPNEEHLDFSNLASFTNDFEQSVFIRHPRLAQIKQQLLDLGAFFASMSGSGSTLYGLFNEPVKEYNKIFSDSSCHQEQIKT